MKRVWGQIDLKPVLVTLISTAIISGFGYLWSRVAKVDVMESRLSRMEMTLERIEERLPPPSKRR